VTVTKGIARETPVTRRQLLTASLIGVGGLAAAATGLTRLETLVAAPPTLGGWRRLTPKTAPSPRAAAAMAYDAARRVAVLFGGKSSGKQNDDTWTWDSRTWTLQSPQLSPPAREGASFAYHPPTKTVVLFGGLSAKGADETWLWNGRTWTAAPDGGRPGIRPEARGYAPMAFDPTSGALILFGGNGISGRNLNDTWKWDGTSWLLHPDPALQWCLAPALCIAPPWAS
jgi:hypothetical protein